MKDGKSHDYWSVVGNRRLGDGRVVQRQMLYLGKINASQREAWRRQAVQRLLGAVTSNILGEAAGNEIT